MPAGRELSNGNPSNLRNNYEYQFLRLGKQIESFLDDEANRKLRFVVAVSRVGLLFSMLLQPMGCLGLEVVVELVTFAVAVELAQNGPNP